VESLRGIVLVLYSSLKIGSHHYLYQRNDVLKKFLELERIGGTYNHLENEFELE